MNYKGYLCLSYRDRNKLKEIYKKSFPKSEEFPFWILKQCSKENNIHLEAIIDYDDKIVGMRFLVAYDDITYLMYLAIDENCRNNGFGSLVLKDLILRNDTVLLCIEKPPAESENIKTHRKNFYLRNGFYETNYFIKGSDVEYEFLISTKERKLTEDDLKKRYSNMTKNPLMKFVIKNTFDENIVFVV